MAKPGSGKLKMQAQRKKQWNSTKKSLKSTGRALRSGSRKKQGCYVATCVYGSYDCPEVWILRRFRDESLERTWAGRQFISIYYALSPAIVRLFGKNKFITSRWKKVLDRLVANLSNKGILDTPYEDK